MGSFTKNLMNQVLDASESLQWKSAVDEWDIEDCEEDTQCKSSCICGKEKIRYLYTICNRLNGNTLYPIGSRCIRRFERDDLSEMTVIQEKLFKLLHAIRKHERIELTTDYFSRRVLAYLFEQGAFKPSKYNGFQEHRDYQFMLNMFNQHSPLTESQQRKVNAIIICSIKPYLEKMLADRIH